MTDKEFWQKIFIETLIVASESSKQYTLTEIADYADDTVVLMKSRNFDSEGTEQPVTTDSSQ